MCLFFECDSAAAGLECSCVCALSLLLLQIAYNGVCARSPVASLAHVILRCVAGRQRL